MNKKRTPPCWTALDENDYPVQIEYAKRKLKYFCPDCKKPMIPKMGEIVSHHFAHKPADDGSEAGCGGEGYRHFRVKTFVHEMLNSISKQKLAYDISFEMEKLHGEDIPDISIIKHGYDELNEKFQILAIEIIDTHPPSDEKRNRWDKNMLEIKITDWTDETIGNSAKLSGSLISYLVGFEKLVSNIEYERIKTNDAMEALERERIGRILRLEERTQKEYEELIKSSEITNQHNLIQSNYPDIWLANWSQIPENERIYESEMGYGKMKKAAWGVSIKSYDGKEPKPGDWVWIWKKKTNQWQHCRLGLCYDEIEYVDDNLDLTYIFKHHLIGKPKSSPEFQTLVENYKIMNQL